MQIEVILSPTLYESRQLTTHHITVAVDVLRATTALCAAFQAGASQVVPLNSLDPLPQYHSQGYLIAAERNGSKLPLATCGNSPTEYLKMNLKGQRLAYSTTNGTVSILKAQGAHQVLAGSFANLHVLSEYLIRQAKDPSLNLVILCSGWKGDPAIEDTLFAGALTSKLVKSGSANPLNDAAMMASDLYLLHQYDLYDYVQKATHVHRLQKLGAQADILFAFKPNTCPVVPQLCTDGAMRLITY